MKIVCHSLYMSPAPPPEPLSTSIENRRTFVAEGHPSEAVAVAVEAAQATAILATIGSTWKE